MLVKETLSVHRIHYTMMTEDDILDSKEQDHLRMNVAPDQTIILSLQTFLDHRSLSSKKNLDEIRKVVLEGCPSQVSQPILTSPFLAFRF